MIKETIHAIDDWKKVVEDSFSRTILVLKYSSTCSVSAQAMQEVEHYTSSRDETYPSVEMLVVQQSPEIKTVIADELDIKHESPQLLFLRDGKAFSVLNHGDITYEAIINILDGEGTLPDRKNPNACSV